MGCAVEGGLGDEGVREHGSLLSASALTVSADVAREPCARAPLHRERVVEAGLTRDPTILISNCSSVTLRIRSRTSYGSATGTSR